MPGRPSIDQAFFHAQYLATGISWNQRQNPLLKTILLPVHALFSLALFELPLFLREKVIQDRPEVFEVIVRHGESA